MATICDRHLAELQTGSGIPLSLIEQRGYYTATTRSELERLGFSESQRSVPALVIPIWSVDGEIVEHQIKPDSPRRLGDRWIKYENRKGAKNHLDIHPSMRGDLADPMIPLWITEGIKKGDSAAAHGLCCIALNGVYGWKGSNEFGGNTELSDWGSIALRGRTCFIAFDSDATTKFEVRQAMRGLAAFLDRRGATVRFVFLPSPDGRKVGLDDYFIAGGQVDRLPTYAVAELPPEPLKPIETGAKPKKTYPMTELGNAERLVDSFGQDFRYCASLHRWLVWDGKRWQIDEHDGALVYRLAQDVVRKMYAEAASLADADERKLRVAWALKSENAKPLQNMLTLARTLEGIPVSIDDLDSKSNLLNLANGTLNLDGGEMHQHRREDLITKLIDIPYDAEAECPRWEQFLSEIFEEDELLMRYVWKAAGYSLTGDTSEKCFFYLHGHKGDNGKSVFISTLMSILGTYASNTPTSTILAKNGEGGIPNDLARLKAVRLVSVSEIGEGKRLDEELIKQLTGSDRISARFMRAEWFDFLPVFKIWMTGNYKPVIRGQDKAIWRRVKLIPFNYSVPKEKQDPNLMTKLWDERSGILAWMILGAMKWRQERLGDVAAITEAVESYREEMDVLGEYLGQCTVSGSALSVSSKSLYSSYERWAKANGMKPLTSTMFGRKIKDRGFEIKHTERGNICKGLTLSEDETNQGVYRGGE